MYHMKKNMSVGIIGAGIQGISNALFLQKKGFEVIIFDREEPGSQVASYGNAILGGITGVFVGAYKPFQEKEESVRNCMLEKGYRVGS